MKDSGRSTKWRHHANDFLDKGQSAEQEATGLSPGWINT